MLLEPTILLPAAVVLLSVLWWLSTRRPPGLPPGPGPALPLLGHLHLMEKDPRAKFAKWRRQYGDVFSLYFGRQLVVVLNGYDVIKEALVKQADYFSDRPRAALYDKLKGKGVIRTSGPLWKAQRTTSLEILRELGMGKNLLAQKVQEEVGEYVKAITSKNGQPFDMARLTQISVSNNICSIAFGKRFAYDNPLFQQFVAAVDEVVEALGVSGLVVLFPFLRFIPGDHFGAEKVLTGFRKITDDLIQPIIARHLSDYDEDNVDDFISAYIREMRSDRKKPLSEFLNENNLSRLLLDMFIAGTDTTSMTIRWFVAYILHHPHVQDKCHQDVVRVVGQARPPSWDDRKEMTYLEATIMEVLRMSSIVPIGIPHLTSRDVKLGSYVIPKDTIVMKNLSSVLKDPGVWEDPDTFRPERFIDADGKITRPEQFIPFSTGRRVCLGESLARMELFLYLATMIQHFRLLPPEDGTLPSLEETAGFVQAPKHFQVRAVVRK